MNEFDRRQIENMNLNQSWMFYYW